MNWEIQRLPPLHGKNLVNLKLIKIAIKTNSKKNNLWSL